MIGGHRHTWIATGVLLTALSAGIRSQGQSPTQTPPPRVIETVTVSAREAKVIADGVHDLKGSADAFIATTVADNVLKLTAAMAVSGRTYQIGPLTHREQLVIDLDKRLKKHAVADGPIRLLVRQADSTEGTRAYTLTRSSLITLFADMATDGLIQDQVTRQIRTIVVARMIQDLNTQEQNLIPEREILTGVLLGFKHEDVRGVVTGRVLDVADAIAANAVAYDFVPGNQQEAFGRHAQMGEGDVFANVPQVRKGMVNVRYGGAIYATSVDHFVWFFIRFLLEDAVHLDWSAGRGVALGGRILDYLTAQLQVDAVDAVAKAIDVSGAAGRNGIRIGDFLARGQSLDAVSDAPGLSREPSALGSDYRVLVVSSKEAGKLPELRRWLATRAKDLRRTISKRAS